MFTTIREVAGQPLTMPHAFSGVRAESAATAAIQHPSQFAAVSVKNTVDMTARLGVLGGLDCALFGQIVP
jgi:hypothetical protein